MEWVSLYIFSLKQRVANVYEQNNRKTKNIPSGSNMIIRQD